MKPIRKYYTVKQKRVVTDYYTIEASSKAEALRLFDEGQWNMERHSDTDKEYQPSAEHRCDIFECPNKGEGWTDVPLEKLKDLDFSKGWGIDWHYNGKCEGERTDSEKHCTTCALAMQKGRRLLTLEEKQYLKNTYQYHHDLNTEE
jgi:hypothetical protein